MEHHLRHMGWDLEPRLKEAQTTWGLAGPGGARWRASRAAGASGWPWPRPGSRTRTCWCWTSPPTTWTRSRWRSWSSGCQQFAGALLLITHDRHLLDGVVDRMLELEGGAVTSYDGSYSDYLLERADKEFREARLTEHMQNRLRRELAWLRRGAKARTRKSKLRISDVLDLKDEVQRARPARRSGWRLTFTGGANRSDSLLSAEGSASATRAAPELAGGLDLYLQRGQRIALLGPNGCGKSTLLKLLLGELEPTGGPSSRHPKLAVSAISQGRGELRGDLQHRRQHRRAGLHGEGGRPGPAGAGLPHPVRLPGGPAEAAWPRPSRGGERNRLLLAKAMLQPRRSAGAGRAHQRPGHPHPAEPGGGPHGLSAAPCCW